MEFQCNPSLGHVHVGDSETVDAMARDTLLRQPCTWYPQFGVKIALHRCILAKWQQDWNHAYGTKLWAVKLVVLPWRSSRHFVHCVICLQVGCTCLTGIHLLSVIPLPHIISDVLVHDTVISTLEDFVSKMLKKSKLEL
jgi:hypothetical protein